MKPGIPALSSIVVLLCALISLSVFHPYPYDNVVTRWGLAERLLAAGSLRIDPWASYTGDKASYRGHFYSDKSFLPSAAAALSVMPLGILDRIPSPGSDHMGGAARYLAERLTVSLAFVLLLLLLRKRTRGDDDASLLALAAAGLGSLLLPYSTLLYTHVPAAALLFACYHFQAGGKWFASDILGGLAVAWEYTLILPFIVLVAYRGREYWNLRRPLGTLLVMVLCLTPQLVHNGLAFGHPLRAGYGLEAEGSFPVASRGFFGFTFPSPERLYMILCSPERGILFYMPWAVPGLVGLLPAKGRWNDLGSDPMPVLVVSYFLLYSAQNAATAGWAYGQRYLIPMIPFLALGLARFCRRGSGHRRLAAATLLPAVFIALLGTFGEMHLPVHPVENPIPLPQLNISLRMLADGHHSMWLPGTAGVLVLTLAAAVLLVILIIRYRPRVTSFAWLPLWLLLALLSLSRDWGGRIDYYRGILAQHRSEWELAASYYRSALEDPGAPEVVRTRLERVMEKAEEERQGIP